MTEDELIARYFAPIAGPQALELKDDTALYAPPAGHELALTADAIVAGVHFYPDDPPEAIARKALRVNISDLAAKGSAPQGFLITMALPEGVGEDWIARFALALGDDARRFACPLMGGDTVATPGPLCISITAIGSMPAGKMARRTGARAGDAIYVSGTIGDAALGLYVRKDPQPAWVAKLSLPHRDFLRQRYLDPRPRVELAPAVGRYAHGAMDVSDGMVGDLLKMMRASGARARVELAKTPLSDAARAAVALDADAFEIAITGGDDYEILCTVAKADAAAFENMAAQAGLPVACIGEVVEGRAQDSEFIDAQGRPRVFAHGSYSHF